MKTVKDIFYFVEDVMTITGLSRSKSYKIIADLLRHSGPHRKELLP